jgi:hypothetical protein
VTADVTPFHMPQVYSVALRLTEMYDAERGTSRLEIGQLMARIRLP